LIEERRERNKGMKEKRQRKKLDEEIRYERNYSSVNCNGLLHIPNWP
jgi:hypothetical protein